jgi:hypothetical protein
MLIGGPARLEGFNSSRRPPIDNDMGSELGPTRPDRLTIWPVEGDLFRGRLSQTADGAWEVRVGPVPGTEVARVIDQFVW